MQSVQSLSPSVGKRGIDFSLAGWGQEGKEERIGGIRWSCHLSVGSGQKGGRGKNKKELRFVPTTATRKGVSMFNNLKLT